MNSDICIAHGGDLSEPSGGTDRVSAITSELAKRGYDVTLIVPEPDEKIPDIVSGVSIETVPVATGGISTQPKRAYHIAKRARQLAHDQDAFLQIEHSTLAGVGTFFGDGPFLVDMHDLAFQSPLYGDLPMGPLIQRFIRYIESRAVRQASHVVVVSDSMKELVCSELGISRDNVSVIPNGYFRNRIADFQGLSPVEGRVTFLGTLHVKLDVERFIEIAKLPSVEELVVIGDGNKREALEAASEEAPSMRVTGRLPDEQAFELVGTSQLALNPQHPSGLQAASSPVKFAYYAALGVPAVVTAGPDLADQLAEKGCMEVVDPGKDFVGAVKRILNDSDVRNEMSNRAIDVSEQLTWERRVEALATQYESLIGAK